MPTTGTATTCRWHNTYTRTCSCRRAHTDAQRGAAQNHPAGQVETQQKGSPVAVWTVTHAVEADIWPHQRCKHTSDVESTSVNTGRCAPFKGAEAHTHTHHVTTNSRVARPHACHGPFTTSDTQVHTQNTLGAVDHRVQPDTRWTLRTCCHTTPHLTQTHTHPTPHHAAGLGARIPKSQHGCYNLLHSTAAARMKASLLSLLFSTAAASHLHVLLSRLLLSRLLLSCSPASCCPCSSCPTPSSCRHEAHRGPCRLLLLPPRHQPEACSHCTRATHQHHSRKPLGSVRCTIQDEHSVKKPCQAAAPAYCPSSKELISCSRHSFQLPRQGFAHAHAPETTPQHHHHLYILT